jgi:WD40 repeat protein
MLTAAKACARLLTTVLILSDETGAIGQTHSPPESQNVTSVAWSPKGGYLLSSGFDGTIRLWQPSTCENGPFVYIDDPHVSQEDQEFDRGVMSIAWSPDGVQFVAGVRDGTLRLYGLETGTSDQPVIKEMAQLKVEGQAGVRTVAFSGDGRMLASAGHDGIVRVWATDNKRSLIREFKGHEPWVETVIFSHDSSMVMSGGADGTIRVWNLTTGEQQHTVNAPGPISTMALSPDGKLLAAGVTRSDQHYSLMLVRTHDMQVQQDVETRSRINGLAFSPDGTDLAVTGWGDSRARVWSVESARPMLTIDAPADGALRGASYSPDGKHLVVGTAVGTPVLIRARTGQVVRQFGKCPKPMPSNCSSFDVSILCQD